MNKRYILKQDQDCHWYIVPKDVEDNFNKLMDHAYEVDNFNELDKFIKENGVISVGGAPSLVSFVDPIIE